MAITAADLGPLSPKQETERLATGLKRAQFEIWRHNARFRVCRTGRRFGKTTEAAFELLRAAQLDFRQEVGYLAPSLKDAKRLMWLPLKRMAPRDAVSKINETTLTIELKHFESRIRLFGADRPESIYGEGLDFLAIDEAQSMTKDVWETYASPTLVDRQGHCIIYYRPEGFNWVYDLFLFAEDPANAPDWAAFGFTTLDGENVRPEEIERERRTKSDLSFRQEYLGLHVAGIARVYSEFDRDHSVTNEARDLGGPIWVGMDVNANPFCAVFASKTDDDRLLIWDELGIYGGQLSGLLTRFSDVSPIAKSTYALIRQGIRSAPHLADGRTFGFWVTLVLRFMLPAGRHRLAPG